MRVDAVASVDSARLVGAEICLPIGIGHPAQQEGTVERKLLLVVSKVKIAKLHHGVVWQSDGHAFCIIGKIDPLLSRKIVITHALNLILTSDHRLPAQVERQVHAQSGMVMVNLPTAGVDYHVPFGGRKGSSYGPREQGSYAKEFYTTVKTAYSLA